MAGRQPDPEIAQSEDNLASLSEIEQAAQILLARLRNPADREEAQRILSAMQRIRTREQARRARSRQEWK
jgi:predicted AAA+ superfamily ATPase